MRMIRLGALMSWARLKECRELDTSEYVEWSKRTGLPMGHRLFFVSHRWIRPDHPDPDGEQLRELRRRLAQGAGENDLVFYNYCSLLQRPRTPDEDAVFYRDLGTLEYLSKAAEKVIILSEGYHDYKNRSWCFFEAIVAEGNIHFFDDQTEIKADLDFLAFLLSSIPQITAYDLSYKLNVKEAEIIVATFQHLNACRATHPEDVPLIKEQMVAHFNQRRLTSFGRLVAGMVKYFDVAFTIMAMGRGFSDIRCKPYFEEPEWTRLPPMQPDLLTAILARRGVQPSVFALPAADWEAAQRRHPGKLLPALRLVMPGMDDHGEFLRSFQDEPNWERYIVGPGMIGVKDDPFPTIDHVIHTALERPPSFFLSKNCIYFPLVEEG